LGGKTASSGTPENTFDDSEPPGISKELRSNQGGVGGNIPPRELRTESKKPPGRITVFGEEAVEKGERLQKVTYSEDRGVGGARREKR